MDEKECFRQVVYVANPEYETQYHCAICDFRSFIIDDFLHHKTVEGHSERGFTNIVSRGNVEGEEIKTTFYPCQPCDKTFTSIRAFNGHVTKMHNEDVREKQIPHRMLDEEFKCSNCKIKYKSVESLNKHLCRKEKVPCPKCGVYVTRKEIWYKHILIHSEKNLKCDKCDYVTSIKNALRTHKKVHGEKKHICEICSKSFSHNVTLTAHKSTHEDKIPCPFCGVEFTPNLNLANHIKNKHNQNENFVCNFCSFETLNASEIEAHKVQKHPDNCASKETESSQRKEKKYECEICHIKYNSRHSRRLHMHAKHGDSFYSCSECSYKATQKGGLKSHIERVHRGKKEECPLCHVKIKSLDQHKQYKHPQHYKIYACSKCPYRSRYKSKLQAHLNSSEKRHS